MVGIRKNVDYSDGRTIISSEGDRSTFDDFDWGMDITDKNGLGSSFCQRVLLQDDRLRKQIGKYYEFYEHVVGGEKRVDQVLRER